jgi:hypothetical protein
MIFSPVSNLSKDNSGSKSSRFIGYTGFTDNLDSYSATTITDTGLIVIGLHCENTSSASISSVTVNGASATSAYTLAVARVTTALYYFRTNNITNNIVVTYSNTQLRAGISVWNLYNTTSDTPITSTFNYLTIPPYTMELDFETYNPNNVGIAIQSNQVGNDFTTWTNANERYDLDVESGATFNGADFITPSVFVNPYRVTTTWSSGQGYAVGAIWN